MKMSAMTQNITKAPLPAQIENNVRGETYKIDPKGREKIKPI